MQGAGVLRTEHGHVEMERAHFVVEILGHLVVLMVPSFAAYEALDCFGPSESQMVPLRPAQVELLALVEQLLFTQHAEDLFLAREEVVAREQVLRELVDGHGRSVALGLEDGGAVVPWLERVGEVGHVEGVEEVSTLRLAGFLHHRYCILAT